MSKGSAKDLIPAAHCVRFLSCNVDNAGVGDTQFRALVRNTLRMTEHKDPPLECGLPGCHEEAIWEDTTFGLRRVACGEHKERLRIRQHLDLIVHR